jgi:hypothetical protein
MHTLIEIMQELTKTLATIGIQPFFQRAYEGGKLRSIVSQYAVGVWAGYCPSKSVIFSTVIRFHPGELLDDCLCLHITSEHSEEFAKLYTEENGRSHSLSPIFSERIYDRELKQRGHDITLHALPVLGLDEWCGTNGTIHRMYQSICDTDHPWSEKVPYVADIFSKFMELYSESLLSRFTEDPVPDIVPQWSATDQLLMLTKRPRIHEARKYYWYQAIPQIEESLLTNPEFPLPPEGIAYK